MLKSMLSVILAVLLLTESLLPKMEFHEFSKFPALIKHYRQHRIENPALSFVAFLQLHYQNVQHHEQDHQTHHSLPFSSHQAQNHNCVPVAFYPPQLDTNLSSTATLTEKNSVAYRSPLATYYATSIWQPPKKA